jgi:hypothetical protein
MYCFSMMLVFVGSAIAVRRCRLDTIELDIWPTMDGKLMFALSAIYEV